MATQRRASNTWTILLFIALFAALLWLLAPGILTKGTSDQSIEIPIQ